MNFVVAVIHGCGKLCRYSNMNCLEELETNGVVFQFKYHIDTDNQKVSKD